MRWIFILFFLLTSYSLLLTSTPVLAATPYELLAPIPLGGAGSGNTTQTNPSDYIKGMFMLATAVAGGLAVIKIIFGGITYMSTDAFTGKSEAKNTIQNAIWGLLLAIGAWLILYTINPKLVEFNLEIPIQAISTAITGTPPPGGTPGCSTCVTVSMPHKEAPLGCAAPGPCTVDSNLNSKLTALYVLNTNLQVSEAFPPSDVVTHVSPCHANGTCVDVVDTSSGQNLSPSKAVNFLSQASGVGGTSVLVEVTTDTKRQAMINAGVPANQVKVTAGNGDHYHVSLQ